MKLDFNRGFTGLDGTEIIDSNTKEKLLIGKQLAHLLSVKSPGIEPLKAVGWAIELYKGNPIEIDEADLIKLKNFIDKHGDLTNSAKVQTLECCKTKE